MSEHFLAGELVIDRERELDIFRDVLDRASGPCVVTVEDDSGFGKSLLLQLFEQHATDTDPPAVTACTRLEESAQLMWLVEEISRGLAACGAPLERFEELNLARMTRDHEKFGLSAPAVPNVEVKIINSELRDSPTTGANIAGWPDSWLDGHERAAQEACLRALLDDLCELSRRRTVVLLLDQYERRTPEIEQWLDRALLTRVLHNVDPFGTLVLVVASTHAAFPKLAKQLGPRSADLLCPIPGLSRWGDDHIDQWLEQVGIRDSKAWVPAIRSLLDRGTSLQDLRMFAGELRAAMPGAF